MLDLRRPLVLVCIVVVLQVTSRWSLEAAEFGHVHEPDESTSTVNQTSDAAQKSSSSSPPSSHSAYWYGTLSIALLSVVSLLGAVLIPNGGAEGSSLIQYVLAGFVAMGVGILVGDAIIHLVPQALGLHDHNDKRKGGAEHESTPPPHLGKCLTVVGAIYLLFLFESVCLIALPSSSGHEQDHGHSHQMQGRPAAKKSSNLKSISQQTLSSVASEDNVSRAADENDNNGHHHADENSTITLDQSPVICFGMRNLALIVTLGDAFHNLADGLIIGTSFAIGAREGISSSLAIFCHELPHELGDFAILLSTGLSRTKAVVINLVSSVTSFMGLYIGLSIGSNESAIQWTSAITIGMFLFIAIGDMMPELKSMVRSHSSPWTMFGTQHAAILFGIGFTVAMAVYETDISLAF